MPLYDLKCTGTGVPAGCENKVQNFYHGIKENHPLCSVCSAPMETDFALTRQSLDGVSQEGWPRENWSIKPEVLRDAAGKAVGTRPRTFSSQRAMDRAYKKEGYLRG